MIEARLARARSKDNEFYYCTKIIDQAIDDACSQGDFSVVVNLDVKYEGILHVLISHYRGLGYQVPDDFEKLVTWERVNSNLAYVQEQHTYFAFVLSCE